MSQEGFLEKILQIPIVQADGNEITLEVEPDFSTISPKLTFINAYKEFQNFTPSEITREETDLFIQRIIVSGWIKQFDHAYSETDEFCYFLKLEDEENNLLPNQLAEKIDEVVTQIKMACFLSGAETIKDLKKRSPQ